MHNLNDVLQSQESVQRNLISLVAAVKQIRLYQNIRVHKETIRGWHTAGLILGERKTVKGSFKTRRPMLLIDESSLFDFLESIGNKPYNHKYRRLAALKP